MDKVIGLDFGTTNSAIAVASSDHQARLATFGPNNSFRSVLYFPAREKNSTVKLETQAGPDAINSYLEADTKGRLILSSKSYLASELFTTTTINGRNYSLEDLISLILKRLRAAVIDQFDVSAEKVVLGRPVRFAGADTEADEQLALERLRAAATLAGFSEVTFEFEPVAAAYQYETQLDHDELVLIGDFGGGTSDFTLAQLGPGRKKSGSHPVLGTAGVAIAGDTFDSRIMMNLVAPKLGLGSTYVSMGKELPVPIWIYSQLSSWHRTFMLKDPKTMSVLREVKAQASEPKKIASLIQIINDNLGYALYRAVENTKVELTDKEVADFVFSASSVLAGSDSHSRSASDVLHDTLERWRFESWLQPDVHSIATCVKSLFEQHNVNYKDVGSVFLTGGSSFVPYVRRFFARTFGAEKLRGGEELTTVAKGLALRALES